MFRIITISAIGIFAVMGANAGSVQIQIGGGTGLTSANTSFTGTGTNGGLQAYQNTMFANATGLTGNSTGNVGTILPSTTMPSTNVPNGEPNGLNSTPQGETLTAKGVTFSMIDDGLSPTGGPDNYWTTASQANTSGTITTLIDRYDVLGVYTMLNDTYGAVGASPVTVTFNFDSVDDTTLATGTVTPIAFTLVNGTVYRDATDCTTPNPNTCPSYATTLDTTNYYSTTGANLGTSAPSGPSVAAFNVWSGTYSNNTGGAYVGTSGKVFLDAQQFMFTGNSAVPNDYLINMVVTDSEGATVRNERVGLSAVTVFTATPEPSTVLLLVTGLGVIGFSRVRRRRS